MGVAHFWWSLVLLGLGSNFMFVGGSTLLTEGDRPSEKAKAQGLYDFQVFCTPARSSFPSGLLLKANGWVILNCVAIPSLLIAAIAMVWMLLQQRGVAAT